MNLNRNIRFQLLQAYRYLNRLNKWFRHRYNSIKRYLDVHPKVKKRTLIFGPPGVLVTILLIVLFIDLPSKSSLRNIQNQVASEVYSADSVLLGRYYLQDRTEVPFEKISPSVINALIATEDVRFYEHGGVDLKSLGRVLVKSVFMQDESSGGGSTLTQQLSKNLFPRKRYWVTSLLMNKLREILTANRLESVYTKKELLTLYLNTVPFADNTFGIEAAAKRFFSTTAYDLGIDQAAVLVGMLKANTTYNPRLFPERSRTRRNVVLAQMTKYNYLASPLADSLSQLPLNLQYSMVSHHQGLAPYFREFLKQELLEWCKNQKKEDGEEYNLYTDGLKIYTTLHATLQRYAEQAVTQQMTEIQQLFFDHWGKEKPWKDKEEILEQAIQRTSRYQKLKAQELPEEDIMLSLQKPTRMKFFSWDGVKEVTASPIDSIIHHLQFLNVGFLAMEPTTGAVKAWVGGIDHDFYQYDHIKTSTKRQVGSIFKPIVYAMAIEEGAQPCNLRSASQKTYIDKEGVAWTPRNMQQDYRVDYTMRGALAYSVNTVSVKLIEEAGIENTLSLARKMGITSELPDVPSIALGSSSISLMEMTTAYACFANNGMPTTPYYIEAITDRKGNIFTNFKPKAPKQPALSEETTKLVINLLQTVVQEGTASRLRWKYGVYSDVGGKTGTTQANADGWFMAISPNLVMGSWVGADDPRIRFRSSKLGQGSSTALPITGYFLKQVNSDPAFADITNAKFPPLPTALRERIRCDLYELTDDLQDYIKQLVYKRDSTLQADTLTVLGDETFLETIYKRKLKLLQAAQHRDSLLLLETREDIGG